MTSIRRRLAGVKSAFDPDVDDGCGCAPAFDGAELVVDATDCEARGRLASSADCRAAVVDALSDREAVGIRIESVGKKRRYDASSRDLLVAAGRFAEAIDFYDERLAERARRDPLAACREATGRAGPVATVADESGLAGLTEAYSSYETALTAYAGPTASDWLVDDRPPEGASLVEVADLQTGGTVRIYETPTGPDRYYLGPAAADLDETALRVLEEAYGALAAGAVEGDDRAAARAVRSVVDDATQLSASVELLATVLGKHASGHGLLADLFADAAVSDVYVSAPAGENCLRVDRDGETLVTNLRLTDAGMAGLSSRFRRESGRAFSRADPTLDASTTVAGRQVRVAGVTEPTSDGAAFAFRAQDDAAWTLPALVANDSLTARAAALLSLAVERGGAILTAGPRGAGKTTLLGALLWELPPTVRTVVIEDTPELPVETLQESGRDVQGLLASAESEELSTEAALRTALRLGDGALAIGEVRGEEAAVLYEAMRVGASSEAVLGTIHGDGADAVFERVVSDLGVPASSFGVTDLVVTCEITSGDTRRIRTVEEVVGGETPAFEPLFDRNDGDLVPTGRIDRGNSAMLAGLTHPEESYAVLRDRLVGRERLLETLADRNATGPTAVTESHERRCR